MSGPTVVVDSRLQREGRYGWPELAGLLYRLLRPLRYAVWVETGWQVVLMYRWWQLPSWEDVRSAVSVPFLPQTTRDDAVASLSATIARWTKLREVEVSGQSVSS